MMHDYFQIAGELWTAVIVGFLLLAVAHYGYGKWLVFQQRRRTRRIEDNVMAAIAKWEATYGRRLPDGVYQWDHDHNSLAPTDAAPPESLVLTFLRPMGVTPPEHGYILESRFHLDAENDQAAIDALMGKETADE